jgi:hypothetical protein
VSDGGSDDDDIREVALVSSSSPGGGGSGGSTTTASSSGGEVWQSSAATGTSTDAADRYCGNCEHFEYVRTERGIQPYCGFHDGVMADMDACEDWSGR